MSYLLVLIGFLFKNYIFYSLLTIGVSAGVYRFGKRNILLFYVMFIFMVIYAYTINIYPIWIVYLTLLSIMVFTIFSATSVGRVKV
jgi:hypothetical protein